jgi:hypothetical protein
METIVTIVSTAFLTLLIYHAYKETREQLRINKEAKEAGLKWMVRQEVLKYLEELKNDN